MNHIWYFLLGLATGCILTGYLVSAYKNSIIQIYKASVESANRTINNLESSHQLAEEYLEMSTELTHQLLNDLLKKR